jgi:hypothetical protein
VVPRGYLIIVNEDVIAASERSGTTAAESPGTTFRSLLLAAWPHHFQLSRYTAAKAVERSARSCSRKRAVHVSRNLCLGLQASVRVAQSWSALPLEIRHIQPWLHSSGQRTGAVNLRLTVELRDSLRPPSFDTAMAAANAAAAHDQVDACRPYCNTKTAGEAVELRYERGSRHL